MRQQRKQLFLLVYLKSKLFINISRNFNDIRSHVWGHFCLCYKGQKLLNDKAYIRRLGIKDGDQIKFVRHVTINYRPTRQQMIKNQSDELKQPSISSDDARNCDSIEEDEEGESMFIHGSKVANFLKGWFSYRKFRNSIV
uniref:SNRNP25 ubiquitin-like domain-containing protein n=1 Tax=Lactuca sativa TaxID=4236 RepID=A0A9R1XFB3_LACSA|nr:hypothetical protein LSAT_V11C400192120 [Lactuca sativa]